MKIIAEGECWSQKWSQDRADTESVSDQQFCCVGLETLWLHTLFTPICSYTHECNYYSAKNFPFYNTAKF